MDEFEAHRPHLHAVATRILGSRAEADDALQEAWIRVERADTSEVENIGGWLTTVVSRVCLTMLDARKRRREEALEAGRLPDPIITRADDTAPDPEGEALAADAVGAALLVVLETLQPRRAPGVRAPRRVRGAVRGHRADRRPLAGGGATAGVAGAPPRPGRRPRRADRRPRGRRRVPGRGPQRRLRGAARGAGPRRRPARRRRRRRAADRRRRSRGGGPRARSAATARGAPGDHRRRPRPRRHRGRASRSRCSPSPSSTAGSRRSTRSPGRPGSPGSASRPSSRAIESGSV